MALPAPLLLPPQRVPLAGALTCADEWYRVLGLAVSYMQQAGVDPAVIADIQARLSELEQQGNSFLLQGLLSVEVFGTPESGLVSLQLLGDVDAPGNTYYYGTGPTGTKGWFAVADAVSGADSVVQTVGSDGISTFNLDGDTSTPDPLSSYAANLAGDKGWFRPALFESTGLLGWASPFLSINGSDPTTFDVGAAIVGYTDYDTNPVAPTRAYAVYGPTTGNAVPNLANIATWVGIQAPGVTLVTQSSAFTPTQRRTIVQLGAVISNGTQLIAVNDLPVVMRAGINQIGDFMRAVGPINSGNLISPNGANLNINKGAGSLFKEGANFVNNPDDPHNLPLASLTAATFAYRTSTSVQAANTTSINVTQYESSPGVLSTVGNNNFTVQRVYVFTSNLIRIQYGQTEYPTMAAAEAAIATQPFNTEPNIAENGVLLCFLIVEKNATALNNAAQAKFIPASKFGGPVGSGGTSITNTDALPEGVVNLYFTNERAQDAVGTILVDSASIDFTYNDGTPSITAAIAGALGAGGTTAQFYRGDKTWSNTLTGSLQVASGPNMTTNGGLVVAGVTSGSTTYGAVSDGRAWVTCSQLTNTLIDFDPMPQDGTSNSFFRLWRNTNTTGQTIFDVHIGTNTNTPNHRFSGKGADSFLCGNNGTMVVGATAVSGGAAKLQVNGVLAPTTDNTRDLGEASFRWAVVRAGTGTINTSDGREKAVRGPLTASELAVAAELAREIVVYQFNDAIAGKGPVGARLHVGWVAQRVAEIMQSHGLDGFRYGFLCYDEWDERPEIWRDIPEQQEVRDEATGEVVIQYEPASRELVQAYRPAGNRYGLRQDELQAFIAAAQEQRIAALEAMLGP